MKKLSVMTSGVGSEFCQGTIPKNQYEGFKSYDLGWNDYCMSELELDGYWDISNISGMTGISTDNAKISISIDDKEVFYGDYHSLFPEDDASSISISDHGVMAVDKNEVPNDHVLITAITTEKLHAIESVEVDCPVGDSKIEHPSEENDYKCFINGLEFGLILESTDGMGYGTEYGDYILGFIYDNKKYEFEYPGGVGVPDVYIEEKPDWL